MATRNGRSTVGSAVVVEGKAVRFGHASTMGGKRTARYGFVTIEQGQRQYVLHGQHGVLADVVTGHKCADFVLAARGKVLGQRGNVWHVDATEARVVGAPKTAKSQVKPRTAQVKATKPRVSVTATKPTAAKPTCAHVWEICTGRLNGKLVQFYGRCERCSMEYSQRV